MSIMQPPAVGTIVDQRYLLTEFVAEGGMGTVYRARDLRRSETVAIKVLRSHDSATVQRFSREVRVLHDLSHPNIVRYVGHGQLEGGSPYLVMEWLSGEDLAARLQRGPLPIRECVELGIAIASALAAAHHQGVIHRDIKPGNIFLVDGQAQHVRLLDFGIARPFSAVAATRTGTILGTPDYMAPEQVRGGREIDGRTDLFSLGCVLFEALGGRPPFASEQMVGVFAKILFEPAPDIGTLRSQVPSSLRQLLIRLLDKDRERRPSSADEVLSALLAVPTIDENQQSSDRTPDRGPIQALTSHEQRLLSVVIAAGRPLNMVDAPTLSASIERDLLSAASGLGAPFGARFESLPDGTLLALLSDQPTAFDQARQAARLALRLRERCRKLFAADNATAAVRIAVCTGRGDWQQGILDAGAIERALLLLSSMPNPEPGSEAPIALDDVTRGLLDARFLTSDHLLLAERSPNESVLAAPARKTPFFGRDRELDLLLTLLGDSIQEERARAVVIVGEAGVGKSRLSLEFLRRAQLRHEHILLWTAQGDALSTSSPFGLLAQSVRRIMALRDDEASAQAQLAAFVAKRVPASEQPRVREFLSELLALSPRSTQNSEPASPALAAARLDPQLMGDQIRRAVLDLLEGECRQQPVVWILEDLQWGDQPTVRLIDLALRQLSEKPFFVVALARPNLHDVFPRLWEGRDVQEVRLSTLPRKASERIARAVLGASAASDLVQSLVERAAGSPFYLEELLRAAQAGELHEVPETVLALVQSRIERLLPDVRRVLRAGCVFGMVFWRGGIVRLLGDGFSASQLKHYLDLLVHAELVQPRPTSHIAGDQEYAFASTLIREAAHAMLTEHDRALGHRLAAEFLEAAGEPDAAALAEHWKRSDQPQRAIACYVRATWLALEGNDLDAVIRHAERAIACGASGEALGEVWAAQAEAYMWRGDPERSITCGNESLLLLAPRNTRWFQVIGVLAIAAGRHANGYELQRLCDLLRELGESGESSDAYIIAATRTTMQAYVAGDYPRAIALFNVLRPHMSAAAGSRSPAAEAMVSMLRGSEATINWQFDQVPLHFEHAADLFDAIGDVRNACSQRLDAAIFYLDIADYPRSELLLRQVIDLSDRFGFHRLSSVATRSLGSVLRLTGRETESEQYAHRAIALASIGGDLRVSGTAHVLLAQLALHRGDLPRAAQEADRGVTDLARIPRFLARALAVQSRIKLLQGDLASALRSAAQRRPLPSCRP